ncbi:MAG: hypothetical protein HY907_10105 [Deltaproteobacteria bacterium]|nr:hypothetical protein [Deltaproteobacteria bacterium]
MTATRVASVVGILCFVAGACRRGQPSGAEGGVAPGSAAAEREAAVERPSGGGAPHDGARSGAEASVEGGAAPAADTAADDGGAPTGHGTEAGEAADGAAAEGAAEGSASSVPAALASSACPRPLGDENELLRGLWRAVSAKLQAHYGIETDEPLGPLGAELTAVATGEGKAIVAAAYGVARFSLWRQSLDDAEWAAVEERVAASRERLHGKCMAEQDEGAEAPEEMCEHWLDEDPFDPSVVEQVWKGIAPVAPAGDCAADGLHLALFEARLDGGGGIDPASLDLVKVIEAKVESRCNPEAQEARFVDVDRDGALELVFLSPPDEHDDELWKREPVDLSVFRLDLSLQHHQLFPGLMARDDEDLDAPGTPQLRFWFEDRTGDDHPDLVVATFRYAGDCDPDPVPGPGLTGCEEQEPRDEFAPTLEDFPECVRLEEKVELRRAYDPERDGWRTPAGPASEGDD